MTDQKQPAPVEAETQRPDPRQPAYDAVFAYIRQQPRDFLPTTIVDRNAMIWHAVHAALAATPVGRCISSHCVEGDHIIDLDDPAAGPTIDDCAADDRRWWDGEKDGDR